jgi:DNA polymerase-3 subunit delta
MAVLSEAKQLTNFSYDKLASLYLLCGDEDYRKRSAVQAIVNAAVDPAFRDFDLHKFDGKETSFSEMMRACEAFPLSGGRSCVVVRDFPIEKEKDKLLEEMFFDLPDYCSLVFWMVDSGFSPTKNKAAAQVFEKYGQILCLNRPDEHEIRNYLFDIAKSHACTIDANAVRSLAETVGGDLNRLFNEAEKVCLYVGSGVITAKDIDMVCIHSVEARTFDMAKAVAAGNPGAALQILQNLFAQRTAPELILAALITHYVDIYRAWACKVAHISTEKLTQLFDYKGKTFRIDNAKRAVARMSDRQVQKYLEILDNADRQLKSTAADAQTVLECCVIRLAQNRA